MNHDNWTDRQRTAEVTVDGHDLDVAYVDAGTENHGPPVVLLHGIPTWSFLWRHVVVSLAEERRVIAPDLLGYGNSSMPDGFDRSIRAQEVMLSGLLDIVDAAGIDLVGHDIGGGVALRFAAHELDRVRRLVLSNAVAYDSWPIDLVVEVGLPTVPKENPEAIDGLIGAAFSEEFMASPPDEDFVEGMQEPWDSEEGRLSLVRNVISLNTNHTTEIDPRDITAKTLLLWGADDVAQPLSNAERLAEDIGDAEVVALDGATHWVMEDRREAYLGELDIFLSDG